MQNYSLTKNKKSVWVLFCMLLALSLGGCSNNGSQTQTTQVAAKVDGVEISLLQVNQVMQGLKDVTEENAPKVSREVLEKLIDQQLIVAKAIDKKLDRTPEVISAIEAAKKDILARAYFNQLVSSSVSVTEQEVQQYYSEHPALFAKRRIYTMQEIAMLSDAGLKADLTEQVTKQRPLQDIIAGLQQRDIKFSNNSYTRPSEQLPLDILTDLQSLSEGQSVVIEAAGQLHVFHLIKAQEAPVDLKVATPFIRGFLVNIQSKALIESEIKSNRQKAKIEYLGEFKNGSAPAVSGGAGSPDTNGQVSPISDPALSKGVAGLK